MTMAAEDIEFYRALGRRIHDLRSDRGLTQEGLGRLLHPPVTRASIANVETAKQRILVHTLVQLADALGASLDDLLPRSSAPPTATTDLHSELQGKLRAVPERRLDRLVEKLTSKGRRKS